MRHMLLFIRSDHGGGNVRAILANIVNPLVWRIPGHGARKLFSFSLAEHGSMLDLKAAARLTPSEGRRAAYVRHLLDETRHAQMFALRSAELRRRDGLESLGSPDADTENLFESLGEVRFLAFVHRGELRGREQFETYRDWFARRGDDRSRALFDAIVRDERQHETYTWELLVELTGGVSAARAELRKAVLWEAWRTWRRAGRFLSEKLYFVLMLALYAMLAPFTLVAAVMRPARRGWVLPPNEREVDERNQAAVPAPSRPSA
jgi:uncharacterized membrane protein